MNQNKNENIKNTVVLCMKNLSQISGNSSEISCQTKVESNVSSGRAVCRICYQDDQLESFSVPCQCLGSMANIHLSCMAKWMQFRHLTTCELCQQQIVIRYKTKPLKKWVLPKTWPTPIIFVLLFMSSIIIGLTSILVDSIRKCITYVCGIFYVVNGLCVFFGCTFAIMWLKYACSYIKEWIILNQEWEIDVNATKAKYSQKPANT